MKMNEEMQTKIIQWLESGEALVTEQMPIIIEQIIAYAWAEAIIIAAFQLAFILQCIYFCRKFAQKKKEYAEQGKFIDVWWDGHDASVLMGLSLFCGLIVSFFSTCAFALSTLPLFAKLYLAPNLYALQQLKYLMN